MISARKEDMPMLFCWYIFFKFCFHFSALSDSFRNYFLNGDYVITNPAKHKIAGTVFTYERTGFGQERIFSLGPTAVPVHVEVNTFRS